MGASACAFSSFTLGWHFSHFTSACLPSSGKFVFAWLKRGVAFQETSLWHFSHLLLSCPRCSSKWHWAHCVGKPRKVTCFGFFARAARTAGSRISRSLWQSAHLTSACGPGENPSAGGPAAGGNSGAARTRSTEPDIPEVHRDGDVRCDGDDQEPGERCVEHPPAAQEVLQ